MSEAGVPIGRARAQLIDDGALCRAWVRLTGSLLTFYKLDPALWPGQWPATVLHRSPEAITLLVTCRLEPGTHVKVEVGAAEGKSSRAERVEVTEVQEQEDGQWAVKRADRRRLELGEEPLHAFPLVLSL